VVAGDRFGTVEPGVWAPKVAPLPWAA